MTQAGEAPTQANAQRLIGRLLRKAELQPTLADACLTEAAEIEVLAHAGRLPAGQPECPDISFAKSILAPPPTSRWGKLYLALAGRQSSAAQPYPARFKGPHGQYFYLSPQGALRQGISLRRSVAVPPAKVEEILAAQKPSTLPTASLADLKKLF